VSGCPVEHWGDEGEFHVAHGWFMHRRVLVDYTEDYIKADMLEPDVSEYLQDVKPENVRYGWAIEVPHHDAYPHHPLHRGTFDDGSIILGTLFRPPFFIFHDGRRLHVLFPRPVMWLRDH